VNPWEEVFETKCIGVTVVKVEVEPAVRQSRLSWCFSNTHRIGIENLGDIGGWQFLTDEFGLVTDGDGVLFRGGRLADPIQIREMVRRASWVVVETARLKTKGRRQREEDRISAFPGISERDLDLLKLLLGSETRSVKIQTGLGKYLGRNLELAQQVVETLSSGRQVLVVGSGIGDLPLVAEMVRRSGNLSDDLHFASTGCCF